jgi:hypothetical protein
VLPAGCGGSSSTTKPADSAQAVPAGALLYVDVNTDRESQAWKAMNRLGERFSGYRQAVAEMRKSFGSGNGDCSADADSVESAIGKDVGIAITSFHPGGSPSYLAAVAVADEGKAKSLIESCKRAKTAGSYKGYDQYHLTGNDSAYAGLGDGMLLISQTLDGLHEAIEVRSGRGDSIASDAGYRATVAKMPKNRLVTGYVNTSRLASLLSLGGLAVPDQTTAASLRRFTRMLSKIRGAAFSIGATENGIDVHAAVQASARGALPPTTASTLLDRVPADSFAFLAGAANPRRANLQLQQLLQLQATSGAQGLPPGMTRALVSDVQAVLSGEALLYLRPGLPVAGALLLKPVDPARALAAIRHLAALGFRSDQDAQLGAGGVTFPPGIHITWKRVGSDLVAVGNDPEAGNPAGGSLATSSRYRSFLQAAGAPAGANIVLYLDMPSVLRVDPQPVDPNLRPLGGIALWTSTSGLTATADLFVQIR